VKIFYKFCGIRSVVLVLRVIYVNMRFMDDESN